MKIRSSYKFLIALALLVLAVAVYLWNRQSSSPYYPAPSPSASATPLSDNTIRVTSPLPGAYVSSPLVVQGEARGTWFFEASFPVILTDWDGKIIAQTPAQAQSDWMTTDFVPFKATLTFPPQTHGSRGFLILKKDNPSGLPQNEDSREIMVYFQ